MNWTGCPKSFNGQGSSPLPDTAHDTQHIGHPYGHSGNSTFIKNKS